MKTTAKYLLIVLVALAAVAFAQSDTPSPQDDPDNPAATQDDSASDQTNPGNPAFTQEELDQMLAPIALYPDSLLSQVLMAATYPLEVVEAARWARVNPGISGEAAVQAVDDRDWDPSVKSLVAFPQILQTLDEKIDWTDRLGDAFLGQQSQVMDTIQQLRQKAQAAGNLKTNAQIDVEQADGADIDIEPANPGVVYVPYYDPSVVYGAWWWPDYPPVFWGPWPGYVWAGGFAWGFGIGVGVDFFFGGWDWPHHRAFDRRRGFPPHGGGGPGPWRHDPGHRHGVPYRTEGLNRQFGNGPRSPGSRNEFRGHDGNPGFSRPAEPQRSIERPSGASVSRPVEPRPHAFEGIGRGSDTRGFSQRGNSSSQHTAPSSGHRGH